MRVYNIILIISLIIDFLGDANPRNKQSFNNLTRYNNNVVCNNFCPTTHRHRRVVKRAAVLPNKEPPPLNRIGKTSDTTDGKYKLPIIIPSVSDTAINPKKITFALLHLPYIYVSGKN